MSWFSFLDLSIRDEGESPSPPVPFGEFCFTFTFGLEDFHGAFGFFHFAVVKPFLTLGGHFFRRGAVDGIGVGAGFGPVPSVGAEAGQWQIVLTIDLQVTEWIDRPCVANRHWVFHHRAGNVDFFCIELIPPDPLVLGDVVFGLGDVEFA